MGYENNQESNFFATQKELENLKLQNRILEEENKQLKTQIKTLEQNKEELEIKNDLLERRILDYMEKVRWAESIKQRQEKFESYYEGLGDLFKAIVDPVESDLSFDKNENFTVSQWLTATKTRLNSVQKANLCILCSALYKLVNGDKPFDGVYEYGKNQIAKGAYLYKIEDEPLLKVALSITLEIIESLDDSIQNLEPISVSELIDNLGYGYLLERYDANMVKSDLHIKLMDDIESGHLPKHFAGHKKYYPTDEVNQAAKLHLQKASVKYRKFL